MINAYRIIGYVCFYFGITRDEIKLPTRKRALAYPRKIAGYLIHKHTKDSLGNIATMLGVYNHTVICHYYRSITELLEIKDKDVTEDIQKLNTMINVSDPPLEYATIVLCGQNVDITYTLVEKSFTLMSIHAENVVSLVLCLLGDAKADFNEAVKTEVLKQKE